MILGRSTRGANWSDAEKQVFLEIGHDLGSAMIHTLWLEGQLEATEESRQFAEHNRQLLMSMSHELQTPLASIRAHIELIQPTDSTDDVTVRALTAVDRGADRLTKMVNNLIWLSRMDDPHREVKTQLVDLAHTIRIVVEDALTSPDQVQTRTACDLTPASQLKGLTLDVPKGPVWVHGSESELIQLWCNLVANAIKYTNTGGEIRITVRRLSDKIEVAVTDDGIGIAPAEVGKIFEDFYRSDSPAVRARTGTGLGLGIARRIVARHHGHIGVDQTAPGTTFVVALNAAFGAATSWSTLVSQSATASKPY